MRQHRAHARTGPPIYGRLPPTGPLRVCSSISASRAEVSTCRLGPSSRSTSRLRSSSSKGSAASALPVLLGVHRASRPSSWMSRPSTCVLRIRSMCSRGSSAALIEEGSSPTSMPRSSTENSNACIPSRVSAIRRQVWKGKRSVQAITTCASLATCSLQQSVMSLCRSDSGTRSSFPAKQ